jgi:hypothetical protein
MLLSSLEREEQIHLVFSVRQSPRPRATRYSIQRFEIRAKIGRRIFLFEERAQNRIDLIHPSGLRLSASFE